MKRSPMKRGTTEMTRTEMKPRKKYMRRRSAKMEAMYAGDATTEGRRAMVKRICKERPICEAGEAIGTLLASIEVMALRDGELVQVRIWERCSRRTRDVHEVLSRSARGSILDEANTKAVCRPCHDWIGSFPKLATALGLRQSRYADGHA